MLIKPFANGYAAFYKGVLLACAESYSECTLRALQAFVFILR